MSEYIQDNFPITYPDESESQINENINIDPFPFPSTNIPDVRITKEEQKREEEKEDQKRFFIESTQENTSVQSNERRILFNIINQENNSSENLLSRKKKRENSRRKYDPDNIMSKLEVSFIKYNDSSFSNIYLKISSNEFILDYLNQMIDDLDVHKKIKIRFKKIEHALKKNVAKKKFKILCKKKISDIAFQNISGKYKHFETDNNLKLKEEIENNLPIMKKILDENYLTLFRNVYYPSKREINLKTMYGIDKTIYLSNKVKMFKDLIKKLKDNEKEDEYYIDKFKKVVNEYYFEGKLKFFS